MNSQQTTLESAQPRDVLWTLIGEIQTSLSVLGLDKGGQYTLAASLKNLVREQEFDDSLPFVVVRLDKGNETAKAFARQLEALLIRQRAADVAVPSSVDTQPANAEPTEAGANKKGATAITLDVPTQASQPPESKIIADVITPVISLPAEVVSVSLMEGAHRPREARTVPDLPPPKVRLGGVPNVEGIHATDESTFENPLTLAGSNTIEAAPMTMLGTERITTSKVFSELLNQDSRVANHLRESIQKDGYDSATPVIVWDKDGCYVLIDGHHRLDAARAVGLKRVPVVVKKFADETEALLYAVRSQTHRRNLSDPEIVKLVELVDNLKARGGDRRSAVARSIGSNETIETSAAQTASVLGISEAKVKRTRRVIKNPRLTERVRGSELSINQAETLIRNEERPTGTEDMQETPVPPPAVMELNDATRKAREQMGEALCFLEKALVSLGDADGDAHEAILLALEIVRGRIATCAPRDMSGPQPDASSTSGEG